MEAWKPIPKYEALYEVSNSGRVRRIASGGRAKIGHILTATPDACGYLRLRLCRGAKDQQMHKVHRLVLAAFIEPRGPEWTVNHKNGVRSDNRLDNLEYLSHAENVRYSALSYSRPGELNSRAKLKEAQVRQIRTLYAAGDGLTKLARKFGTNKYVVYDIVNRRSWTHI